ncbi:hypothetical protein [Phenylobacterium sp.]|uniref:hypothetical protein n=1 Tax=Phenylobacterium sp. TaxID=1871053 RepID=UPI000C8C8808|nr:hypothetical protein [Phenylobacterium sp.]MAK82788.1 hypothetical protein [Phenylobacterium sp.]
MTDEWKPEIELIDWAKDHFSQMSVGGVWMPEASGLTYVKQSDNVWVLKSMINTPDVQNNHKRMVLLMNAVNISVDDSEVQLLPPPENDEQAWAQELHMKREIAQGWSDKDGTLLVDMGLENLFPSYVEDKEMLLENGDTTTIEIWGYIATNPNTDETITIDPDDYHLLMGDAYFMRMKVDDSILTALNREQMVAHIDDGGEVVSLGSKLEDMKVPPWMWGTTCKVEELPLPEGQTTLDDYVNTEEE